jgi:hypothetical protein
MDQCITLPGKLFRRFFRGDTMRHHVPIGPERKSFLCTLNDVVPPVNENQVGGTRLQIQGKDDNQGMEIETNPYRYREILQERGT